MRVRWTGRQEGGTMETVNHTSARATVVRRRRMILIVAMLLGVVGSAAVGRWAIANEPQPAAPGEGIPIEVQARAVSDQVSLLETQLATLHDQDGDAAETDAVTTERKEALEDRLLRAQLAQSELCAKVSDSQLADAGC